MENKRIKKGMKMGRNYVKKKNTIQTVNGSGAAGNPHEVRT